jgi:hypothetical protein
LSKPHRNAPRRVLAKRMATDFTDRTDAATEGFSVRCFVSFVKSVAK